MSRRDCVIVVLLAAATVAHLASLPNNLGATDESDFLYQAKRLADGEVMYRDVFNIITPLSLYLTAFVFKLFGVDMTVARLTIAAVHALTVAGIYACARFLGVRSSLAVVGAAAYVALCQPAWPFVSPHWFSTAVMVLLLLSLLRCPWAERPGWAFVPGALAGIMIGIQQAKGVPIVTGGAAVLATDHLLRRRGLPSESWRQLATRLLYFGAGITAVVVPLFGTLALVAGIEPLVRALVLFPLVNYRQAYGSQWGGTQAFSAFYAKYTLPLLLTYAPLSLLTLPVRLALQWWRNRDPLSLRPLSTLLIWGVAAIGSITYYPDVIHLAFIGPIFLIAGMEALEWALGRRAGSGGVGLALSIGTVAAGAAVLWQLQHGRARAWREFPVAYPTAFGRIDLSDRRDIAVLEKARELVQNSASREMFCYPSIAGPYLVTGGHNPTPYGFFSPRYNDPEQVKEVIATLESRQVPYVMTAPLMTRKEDPIMQYIYARYEYVRVGPMPRIWLFARKQDAR